MRFLKPCQILLLFLMVALLSFNVSAQSYLPSDFGSDYPIVFHWEQSDAVDAHVAKRTGSASFTDLGTFEKPYSIGPPGDYDGDDNIEYPVRSQNGGPYLKFYTSSGSQDFSVSLKPKTGSMLAAAYLDNDGKTDLLFKNQNGYMSAVDSDGESKEYQISSFGDPIDVADIDKDGKKEVLYSDSSANVKYYDIESSSSTNIDPGNDKSDSYSNLADVDSDGLLEYSYATGSLTVYTADKNGKDKQVGSLTSAKVTPQAIFYDGTNLKFFVAGNSNNVEVCTLSSCNPAERKSSGARSVVPPLTDTPQLNISEGTVTQGKTVSVWFNATDYEGYSDILNSEASAIFTDPSASSSTVSSTEITSVSGVTGTTSNNNFVPDDGKTKTFKAVFELSDTAETGQWNVSVQVKDEKMTGTKNWSTFQVEKALVEKNVSESLSLGREDTSRQTSLGKSEVTGLSLDSQGVTNTLTFRDFSESLGFLSGKSRNQSLGKNLMTGMAFSRSGNGFKTVFSTLRSDIFASSEVFDIYSAFRGFDPVFGFSDSPSDKAFFSESVDQSYGLDGVVSGQSLFIRTDPLSLTVDFGGNRSSDVGRSFTVGLEAGSSPLTGLAFGRSFDPVFSFSGIDTDRSGALFSRSSEQGLSFPQSLDKDLGSTYFKTLTTPFDLSSSPVRSGVDLSVSLSSALDLGTDGSRDSIYARSVDSIISSSAESFVNRYLFRGFVTDYIVDSGEMRAQNVSRATDNSITGSFTSSRSSSLDRLLLGSIAQTFGFSRSDAFFERSSSQSISISEVFEGERTFGRAMSFSYSFVSSPVESTAGYFRALSSDLFLDTARDSSVLFERQESTGISSNGNFTRAISVSRYLSTTLTPGLTVEAFDGVMIALDQTLGFGSASSDLFESSRSEDTSLETSSDYSSSISFFRTFSQSVGVDLGLGDLIDFVLEFFRDDPDDGNSGDGDSNGGNNGDGNDGGPTSIPGGDNEDAPVSDGNSSEEENSTNNSAGEKDGNDEDIVKIIEASLRESEVSNNEAAELTENITGVDRGQQLVIDISHGTGRENLSNGSETNPTLEKRDLIHVNTVEFEAERSQEDPDISLTTFDEVGEARSIIKDKNVYEATEVSTNFDTTDASLVYEVEKKFLSTNNATVDEIVVSRWENQSKVGELKTKRLNESEDAYTIRAISPRGFSVFVVSLKSSGQQIDGKPEEGTFISLPKVSPGTISLLLLISTVLLLRREILIKTFTSDLKVKKAKLKASMFFLKLRKRLDVRKEREAGKEEYSLAEEVESLENKVEVMQYKKEKQSEDLERMEEIYKRLRYECTLLAERIKEAT